eukprot:scaffold1523_cov140-Isochrysis_galbana.AAC.2
MSSLAAPWAAPAATATPSCGWAKWVARAETAKPATAATVTKNSEAEVVPGRGRGWVSGECTRTPMQMLWGARKGGVAAW